MPVLVLLSKMQRDGVLQPSVSDQASYFSTRHNIDRDWRSALRIL